MALFSIAVWLHITSLESLPEVNGDEASWYGVQAGHLLQGRAFALHTGNGNPINSFSFGPLILLYLIFGPALWILRALAVIAGILAVIAT